MFLLLFVQWSTLRRHVGVICHRRSSYPLRVDAGVLTSGVTLPERE